MRYETLKYDTSLFDFISLVSEVFCISDLSAIDEVHEELFKIGADSKTTYHNRFYNRYREGWVEMEILYDNFIEHVISPQINEDFLYQKFPTVRVHLKGNVAVGAFHNDAEFGHPKGEINYIIPLTDADLTASVWIESVPGRNDFKAAKMIIGEIIKFNGNELRHGNYVNETGKTRVSMDFRILPISKYDENNNSESKTMNTKYKDGEYYIMFKK